MAHASPTRRPGAPSASSPRQPANSYPLYYFIPSITPRQPLSLDPSQRAFTGWVQLYRLDLTKRRDRPAHRRAHARRGLGDLVRSPRLRGVYNHLSSAQRSVRREVYYFQDDELRYHAHLDTLDNRRHPHHARAHLRSGRPASRPTGATLPSSTPIESTFTTAIADRMKLCSQHAPTLRPRGLAGGLCPAYDRSARHRHRRVCRECDAIWTTTCTTSSFSMTGRLLVNHVRGENGMWSRRHRRRQPISVRCARTTGHGAICHQVITERVVIFYEANDVARWPAPSSGLVIIDLEDRPLHREAPLPGVGYVHTGRDPAGEFPLYRESR
jgi:hypothetical protein